MKSPRSLLKISLHFWIKQLFQELLNMSATFNNWICSKKLANKELMTFFPLGPHDFGKLQSLKFNLIVCFIVSLFDLLNFPWLTISWHWLYLFMIGQTKLPKRKILQVCNHRLHWPFGLSANLTAFWLASTLLYIYIYILYCVSLLNVWMLLVSKTKILRHMRCAIV